MQHNTQRNNTLQQHPTTPHEDNHTQQLTQCNDTSQQHPATTPHNTPHKDDTMQHTM